MKHNRGMLSLKRAIGCITILFCMLTAVGLVQADNDEQILNCLSSNELLEPKQLQVWDNTAACIATQNGQKTLCIMQKQENRWELIICNQKALMQDEELPTLVLDSDDALFWTYLYPDKVVRFHAARNTDGIWGAVDETSSFSFAGGTVWYTYSLNWNNDNGGEIRFGAISEDENGNDLTHERVDYLPAPWLKDCIALNEFDLSRFPSMGFSGDYSDLWPGHTFLSEAASALIPEYTYIKGNWQCGNLHFLMEKPDGSRVYMICNYSENIPRAVSFQESSSLPKGTRLGVENFTDSLGIERNNETQAIDIRSFPAGRNGIRCVWNFNDDDCPLYFGPKSCMTTGEENLIWYGIHPWGNICIMDWEAIPTTLKEARMGFTSEEYACVNNPDPKDRLHLREKPDKESKSLGKYYNGTPVYVSEIRGDWACVHVGDQIGWMMKKYLIFGQKGYPLRCDISAMPQLTSRNYGELSVFPRTDDQYMYGVHYVNTFSDSSYYKVIGVIGDEWYHVWFPQNDEYGYVKQSDLFPGNG